MAVQVRAASSEIEKSLSMLAANTSDQLRNSVVDANAAMVANATASGTQLRATASELESALTLVAANTVEALKSGASSSQSALVSTSNEVSAQIKAVTAEAERSVSTSAHMLGMTLSGKAEELVGVVQGQTEKLAGMIDDKRGALVEAIGAKGSQLTADISRTTDDALKAIEGKGFIFAQSMTNNSADIARMINTASEVAAGAINKSLKDIELSSRNAIDQSRQVSVAAVTEMQETSKMLRTDTVALFERLREGNILLQEVLTGAHANLNSLEQALVSRVAEFVSTMNDVSTRTGATTKTLDEQIRTFNSKTTGALEGLQALSGQFELHGRALAEAAHAIESSNGRTSETVEARKSMLDSLAASLEQRTGDLDDRLTRFNSLLEESMQAAETRAREIARVVAETASTGSSAISQQFETVRNIAEEERRITSEAMQSVYQQGMQEADAMFGQAAERFASIVQNMRQMASEMQNELGAARQQMQLELEATRVELRRGVLELPQEASESTAQMRKVIVDQIEALAELNRIVARHGRGLDVSSTTRTSQREEEPMLASVGSAPRRDGGSASNLPPPDLGGAGPARRTDAPPVSPGGSDGGRDGWLSELLSRADNGDDRRGPAPARPLSGNPLESLTLDITRLLDRDIAADMWTRYQRGERKAFSKRLYTPAGQKTFDEISRKYRADRGFKQTVDRYITEFERLLDDVARDPRGPSALASYLASETGLVYTLLAHASGRLG
jgi:hypothetical protein